MFKNCKTTKDQGNIGVANAIAYFLGKCQTVSIPINDSQDYDLVVDIDNVLHKVQVKTSSNLSVAGNYVVELRTKGGTKGITTSCLSDGNSTLLFVLCGNGSKYLIPKSVFVEVKTSMTLGEKYVSYLVN